MMIYASHNARTYLYVCMAMPELIKFFFILLLMWSWIVIELM